MGMGIVLMGMGIAYFVGEKSNSHRQCEQPAVIAQEHVLTV